MKNDIPQSLLELYPSTNQYFVDTFKSLVAKDHVHLFLNFPPRYAIAKVVGILKSISASELFKEFPELRRQLWGGEFWEDGYFVRTVGDQVTAEVVKRYIQYHRHDERDGGQLNLF